MTKEQLFGKESEPLYTSMFFACVGTIAFWIVFLVVMIFVKPIKQPKYKTVQIVLDSTPAIEKQMELPAKKTTSIPEEKSVTQPKIDEPVETPKIETEVAKIQEAPKIIEKPKTETVKKTEPKIVEKQKNEPAKKTEPKTAKEKQPEPTFTGEYVDPMEAFEALQNSKLPRKNEADIWDSMNDDFVPVEQTPAENYVKPNIVKNSFEGTAGEKTVSEPIQEAVVSEQKASATKATSNALSGIASAKAENVSSSSDVADTVSDRTSKSSGFASDSNSEIKFMFGETRKVISKTEISISSENQNKVTGDVLRISFDVNEHGNVIRNSVVIKPNQPTSVTEEITNQISKWLFSSGDETVTATFNLKIIRN